MYKMDLHSHAERPVLFRSKLKCWCRDLYSTPNAASSAVGNRITPTRLAPHRSCFRCIPLRQSTADPGSDMASQAALILFYEYTIDNVYTFLQSLPFHERDLGRLRSVHSMQSRSCRIIKNPHEANGFCQGRLRGVIQPIRNPLQSAVPPWTPKFDSFFADLA